MKSQLLFCFLFATLPCLAQVRICPEPWKSDDKNNDCRMLPVTLTVNSNISFDDDKTIQANIRTGYLEESSLVPFRGNVIYYEGLGDSMLNHMPLFSVLTAAGYRVIAFDYMGQGGSTGSMDDTRIFEIGALSDLAWYRYARDLEKFPKKNLIGWSTGGLAAYTQLEYDPNVSSVTLIAPGIEPNLLVGEQHFLNWDLITLRTLTTAKYAPGTVNPHIDPIKPPSPLDVPSFAIDLQLAASREQQRAVNPSIHGFVLLSGNDDTYVDAQATQKDMRSNAPQFIVRQYPGTLHEIDNEAAPMGPKARADILQFLNSVN